MMQQLVQIGVYSTNIVYDDEIMTHSIKIYLHIHSFSSASVYFILYDRSPA